MKPAPKWQSIAERLAESGWSWRHLVVSTRMHTHIHLVEARNTVGQIHVVVAEVARQGFEVLEKSINAIEHIV